MMVRVLWVLLLVGLTAPPTEAHDMRQPIPIMLDRMYGVLLLLERGQPAEAIYLVGTIEELLQTKGLPGLHQTASMLDQTYRTSVAAELGQALAARDPAKLRSVIYSLTYLLMLEKLDKLSGMLTDREVNPDTRKLVMDLARDYFSHIFEGTLARKMPAQVKGLEQLLDRMDHAVRQPTAGQFGPLRRQLGQAMLQHFGSHLLPGVPG